MARSTSSTRQPSSSPLTILGVTALIVGVGLLGLVLIQRARISRFRRDGVEVSYFDAPLLEGGDLHFAAICEFVPPAMRRSLRRDDRVPIVYLPQEPSEDVLLKTVVENGVGPVPTMLGAIGITLGAVLLAINAYYNRDTS